jgi:hypothetical protein
LLPWRGAPKACLLHESAAERDDLNMSRYVFYTSVDCDAKRLLASKDVAKALGAEVVAEHLPQADCTGAQAHAHQVARGHADLATAVTVLLELDDADAAEAVLAAEPTRIDGSNYAALLPLAQGFRKNACWRGETAVYRALLRGVLNAAMRRPMATAPATWRGCESSQTRGLGCCPCGRMKLLKRRFG